MAEAVVTFALAKVHDLVLEKGGLSSRVSDDVKELKNKLKEIKYLIVDADKRGHKNDTVRCWIAEIIDLADRAEDAIELYAARVSSKRRRGLKRLLRRYACILKECHSLHQIDSEISEIKSDLERVNKQMQDYGIIKKIVDGGETSDDKARKTYPDFEEGNYFVGLEKELKQLVSLIEGEEHRFISVWGMGGLGKTTIAREVYKHMKRKANSFDRFAWVCISQQFKIRSVLEEALKQLDPQTKENASSLQQMVEVDLSKLSENDLIDRLIKIQRAHRCLIVIDDLWKISHWNHFKHAFLAQALKSKILVTTRKKNVAEIGFSLKLGNLNMDEAWELLKKKAFPHNNIPEIYLSELVSRCVVEVEVEDLYPMDKYRKCKLHDVVREQCLLKGRKEGFGVTFLKLRGGERGTSLLRYLVINIAGEVEEGVDELSKEDTYKLHVRSLKLFADQRIVEFPAQSIVDFQRFKMLRDLVIWRFTFPGRKFPRGITNLVHLRCLRLQRCEELDELPSSISKLVYLEALDFYESSDVRIPNVLKKMLRLKHLSLPKLLKDNIGSYRLRLDEGLDELESLRWFNSRVHELKCSTRMKNLRRLSAFVYDNKSLSVIINALDTNWNKLQACAVSIGEGCELTSEEGWMMLKRLFRCRNLHYLGIDVELGKLPVESMNNMISSLSLYNSEIEDDPMGILGKLPFLGHLKLSSRSFVGEEMTCTASSFPRLKKLELVELPKLREWRVEAGAMPLLSQLSMYRCHDLEKVPNGLSSISTLQSLMIVGMPELVKRVAPSGEDFAKVSHIPSITIHD